MNKIILYFVVTLSIISAEQYTNSTNHIGLAFQFERKRVLLDFAENKPISFYSAISLNISVNGYSSDDSLTNVANFAANTRDTNQSLVLTVAPIFEIGLGGKVSILKTKYVGVRFNLIGLLGYSPSTQKSISTATRYFIGSYTSSNYILSTNFQSQWTPTGDNLQITHTFSGSLIFQPEITILENFSIFYSLELKGYFSYSEYNTSRNDGGLQLVDKIIERKIGANFYYPYDFLTGIGVKLRI